MNETSVTVYESQASPIAIYVSNGDVIFSIDQALDAWVRAKYEKSKSVKTQTGYKQTITSFRTYLQAQGHDLDSDRKIVADCAEAWANASKRAGKEVSAATYKQRLAIVSSFYRFVVKREVLDARQQVLTVNPIERLDRKRTGPKQAARPLAPDFVKERLAKLDRSSAEGLRDYALLTLALTTGKRASELVGLRLSHLHFKNDEVCIVEWVRCKGNKQMVSTLETKVTHALIAYLTSSYGAHFHTLPGDTPVWKSFSQRNPGQAIGYQTIRAICAEVLGTTKFHATRHSAVVAMMHANANMEEIRQFTGHKDIKELTTYLEELETYQNKYASEMENAFCLD